MRIFEVFLILGLLLVPARPESNLTSVPMSGDREQGAARTKTKSGRALWSNRWAMERTMLDGRAVLYFTESGAGIHSPFRQEVRWSTESWWTNDGVILPIRSETTYTDASGQEIRRETRNFDWTRKQVRFERIDSTSDKRTSETLKVPGDTLSVEGIAGVLRGLDFAAATSFGAHLLTNEPKVYDITLEIRGREKVQTAAGAVECYKVELVPHVGIRSVFRFLYPKSYFWFQVDPPHTWIRYEGLENGPGSPEIVMEMTRGLE